MKTAILLVNLGTPDSPTPRDIRKFLRAFLSDRRVVNIPRWIWWFILNFIILPFRSLKLAKLYQSIWMDEGSPGSPSGSPLRYYSESLANKLNEQFNKQLNERLNVSVFCGMTYGNPNYLTILNNKVLDKKALDHVEHSKHSYDKLIVLPLFPQYSSTTTASVFEGISGAMSKQQSIPHFSFIRDYGLEQAYIEALATHILNFWDQNDQSEHLLFSFHGIPKRLVELGENYSEVCHKTALQVANLLKLPEKNWSLGFQSRFGWNEWVTPYTSQVLTRLPKQGVQTLDVISPGFAVDCLETLEELGNLNHQLFINQGGKRYRLISCLNDTPLHVDAMMSILKKYL